MVVAAMSVGGLLEAITPKQSHITDAAYRTFPRAHVNSPVDADCSNMRDELHGQSESEEDTHDAPTAALQQPEHGM